MSDLFVSTFLTTSLAASFICIFFFTYAKNVERQIVINNVEYVVKALSDDWVYLLPDSVKSAAKTAIDKIQLADMTEEDQKVADNNKQLLYKSGFVVGSLFAILFLFSLILASHSKLNFLSHFIEAVIVMMCIGSIEYVFLTFIAQKYVSANPNIVKRNLVSVFG